jgi:serine/threonine protein kinase
MAAAPPASVTEPINPGLKSRLELAMQPAFFGSLVCWSDHHWLDMHNWKERCAAACARTIAEPIQYAHERGVLHRDLKPSNMLLDENGQPHVTDFGLAKLMRKDADLTLSRQIMGNPSYMAPDRGRREPPRHQR